MKHLKVLLIIGWVLLLATACSFPLATRVAWLTYGIVVFLAFGAGIFFCGGTFTTVFLMFLGSTKREGAATLLLNLLGLGILAGLFLFGSETSAYYASRGGTADTRLDYGGKVVFRGGRAFAPTFHDGLVPVTLYRKLLGRQLDSGLAGFADRNGTMVISAKYESARRFSEGLASVVRDSKYGYVDPDGNVVIEPQFDLAVPFSEALAAVEVAGEWGYVDRQGNWTIKPKYARSGQFQEGLAPVTLVGHTTESIDGKVHRFEFEGGRWGFVDKTGEQVIEPQFCGARSFRDGLAAVCMADLWGFIDRSGEWIIAAQYDEAYSFEDGTAYVQKDGEAFSIDRNGQRLP